YQAAPHPESDVRLGSIAFAQQPPGCGHRASAMTHRGLFRIRQLGEASTERWVEEQRVVAESSRSSRRVEDHSLDHASDEIFPSPRLDNRDDTAEPCRAPLRPDIAERFQEALAAPLVIEPLTTEARGTNSGRPAQSVDLESRVVGQSDPTAESGRCS